MPCLYDALYYVDAKANAGGDGTQAKPFNTLRSALSAGASRRVCTIEIHLTPGIYGDSITITKPTSILGTPGVLPDIYGSIDNPNGKTLTLKYVAISRSTGFGIRQRGGALNLTSVGINHVARANNSTIEDGTALSISEGAVAHLSDVILIQNKGQALHVDGRETKVWTTQVKVLLNTLNPLAVNRATQGDPSYAAAVEVTRGASAWMENTTIDQNELIGLLVKDGAKVHFRNGLLSRTKPVNQYYGYNLNVLSQSAVELHDFVSDQASLGAGVREAYLTAITGDIRDNVVGVSSFSPSPELGYNMLSCIEDGVRFSGNQISMGFGEIPLPCPPYQSDCYAHCKLVPWVSP